MKAETKSNVITEGTLVRVQWKEQAGNGQWSLWEMTAVYLGRKEDEYSKEFMFSLRPKAGTTTLIKRHQPIVEVEALASQERVLSMGGVRSPNLNNMIKLPRRIGRTEAPR